jgi:hypothetical protein
LGGLISHIIQVGKFPTDDEFNGIRSNVNKLHRDRPNSTASELAEWLRAFSIGEAEVKNFFDSTAWKGTPGFTSDGKNLSDMEYSQKRRKKEGWLK